MSIRFLSIRALVPTACLVSAMMTLTVNPSLAQQTPPPSSGSAATPTPAPATTTAPPTAAAPAGPKVPDYPDPRSIVVGVFMNYNMNYAGPDIKGGAPAANELTYESLLGIGQAYRYMPSFSAGVPVTRTGMLYADFERFHGSGTQTLAPNQPSFIDTYSFQGGDQISSTYHIITMRIYLDDLLYPEKFPVSKLRFKSIWGLRYISFTQTVDSATEDAVAGLPGSSFQIGTNFIMAPEFGLAMEYALARHVLFRVDGAGFGIPHHSDLAETSATLSVRKNNLEMQMGVKTLQFKTTPQKDEYESGLFITPFVGILWHF